MKSKLLYLIFSIFLFILVLPVSSEAGVIDSIANVTLSHHLIHTLSGATVVSNMISYGNTIEIVYLASGTIYNRRIVNESGSWTHATATIVSDSMPHVEKGLTLTHNETELHFFYCNGSQIKHYKAKKSDHIWSFIENVDNCPSTTTRFMIRAIFDKNGRKIHLTQYKGSATSYLYYCNGTGTLSGTCRQIGILSLYSGSCSFRYITDIIQQNITDNIFVGWTIESSPCSTEKIESIFEIPMIGALKSGNIHVPATQYDVEQMGIETFRDIDAVYFINTRDSITPEGYYIHYVFDTSDTLGVNCTSIARGGYWECFGVMNDTNPIHLQDWGEISTHLDRKGNLHFIYVNSSNYLTHFFQNNSYCSWIRDWIVSIPSNSVIDFVLFGDGTVSYFHTGTDTYFWEEDESLILVGAEPPVPPTPPIPVVEENPLYLICDAGVFLTGSTREGGCLIVSLFIIAVSISIVGRTFHYYEGKYNKEVSNKYLITGAVVIIMIVMTMMMTLTDLFTGIVSIFCIVAFMLVFEERGISMRR